MALSQQQNRWKCGRFIPVLTVMALFGSARAQEAGEHSHQQSEEWARVVATETADAVKRPQANTFLARRSGETCPRRTKCPSATIAAMASGFMRCSFLTWTSSL
jgi:hypothetical protein